MEQQRPGNWQPHGTRRRRLWRGESPPQIDVGDYVQTKRLPTSIRCKAYTAPPQGRGAPRWEWSGQYIATIEPATYLGPIESIARSDDFLTIRVEDWWINVWSADFGGTKFAFKVPVKVV